MQELHWAILELRALNYRTPVANVASKGVVMVCYGFQTQGAIRGLY